MKHNYKILVGCVGFTLSSIMFCACSPEDGSESGGETGGINNPPETEINPFCGQSAEATGLPGMFQHQTVSFNGNLFTLGGRQSDATGSPMTTSYTSTSGQSWSTVTGNLPQMNSSSTVVFKNKMWMISRSGVWSSADGSNWIQATNNPGFNFYLGQHTTVVFNNKLYSIGPASDNISLYSSLVYSSSDGINWSLQKPNNNNYLEKLHGQASVVFDNKIWVIGGSGYDQGFMSYVYYSTDGITWKSLAAGFRGRKGHSLHVYDGKIWLIGGRANSQAWNDIWYSPDGQVWIQYTPSANFGGRQYHTVTNHDGKLVLIGGMQQSSSDPTPNDVWYLN